MTRMSPISLSRPAAGFLAAVALLAAGACGDGTGPGDDEPVVPKPQFAVPAGALAVFDCTAEVQPAAVSCAPG